MKRFEDDLASVVTDVNCGFNWSVWEHEKAFDEAFYSQCGCNRFDETLSGIVGIDETLFARVFNWRLTPEGRSFWLKISDLWYDRFLSD